LPETTHQKQSTLVFWFSLVNLRIKATTFGNKDNKYKEKIKEYIFYRKKKKKKDHLKVPTRRLQVEISWRQSKP
jgi:hypothetical protein